ASRGPAARYHAADYILRSEPALLDPAIEPRPAEGRVQSGQLLVLEQRRDCGMIDVPKHREPGRRDPDPGGGQRLQQLRRRIWIYFPTLAGAARARHLSRKISELGRARPGQGRPGAE